MGDRTSVTLTIRDADVKEAAKIDDSISDRKAWDPGGDLGLSEFYFDEVNYGELSFLKGLLKEGIPYSSCWGSGDEYGPGGEFGRFDAKGNPVVVTNYLEDDAILIDELSGFIDEPEKLRELITSRDAVRYVIPWEEQEANIKVYLAKKLIGATDDGHDSS